MVRSTIRLWLVLWLGLSVVMVSASLSYASSRMRLDVGISKHHDYIRLIFQGVKANDFAPTIRQGQLMVPLGRAHWGNLAPVNQQMAEHISASTLSRDGKQLILTLLKPEQFRVRPFLGEDFVGLDLVKKPVSLINKPKIQQVESRIEERIPPQASAQPIKQEREPQLAIVSEATPAQLAQLTPSANAPDATLLAVVDTLPEVLPAIENVERELVVNVEAPGAAIPAYSELTFTWNDKVAGAVFRRGNYSWLIFDAYRDMDMSLFLAQYGALFSDGEQLESRKYTILRLKHRYPFSIATTKQGDDWHVIFTKRKNPPAQPLPVNIRESSLHGSMIEILGQQFAEPLRLFDPLIGDELIIVPSYEAEAGVGIARQQTDFDLLQTAQGVAVILKADDVKVTQEQFALVVSGPTNRITSNESAAMKERLEALQQKREAARQEKLVEEGESSLVKFTSWKGDESFTKQRQLLEEQIMLANWGDKNAHRLRLAQFYLAQSMEVEALGVIEAIRVFDPDYAQRQDVLLVEGAANYLAGRYQQAQERLGEITLGDGDAYEADNAEIRFWQAAASLKLGSTIKMDKFVSNHPLKDAKKDDEQSDDQKEITQLILDTSSRLLKMIKKIDPELATNEEIQTLESTARFVSSHYLDEIKRFGETEVYRSGDAFEAADESQWWNISGIRAAASAQNLDYLPNRLLFLKDYPTEIYNHFALLALEERLENNDVGSAERILETFRDSDDEAFAHDLTYLRGLFYAKDDEIDLALKEWESLEKLVDDRYNRARSQFASVGLKLKIGRIDLEQAIQRFNAIRMVWRGDVLELNLLKLLGEFYMDQQQYMQAFRTWREVLTNFPGSEDALLIAKRMNQEFVFLFNSGGANQLSQLEALKLYYEFRELTPVGRQGDQMILKLVERLVDVDLLDRASALLTHLVRFRLTGEEKHLASTRLAEIYLLSNQYDKVLDALNATNVGVMNGELQDRRRYIKAKALINIKQNNQALALLREDETRRASFLRAEIYWRNKVWRKVIDELEYPFKEIVRQERSLDKEEREALNKIAIAYALSGDMKRLKILEEDFSPFVPLAQQKLLAFIADDENRINYRNLEDSLGLDKMEDFLQNYMSAGGVGSSAVQAN